jgi:cobalt-zinc-cadmium efflux system membrane fusion protein
MGQLFNRGASQGFDELKESAPMSREPETKLGTRAPSSALTRGSDHGVRDHAGAPLTSSPKGRSWRGWLVVLGIVVLAVGSVAATLALRGTHNQHASDKEAAGAKAAGRQPLPVELVKGMPHTLYVPESVQKALSIGKSIQAEKATHARPLVIPGSTALDPTRLMRVKTRFNAEVVEIGHVQEFAWKGTSSAATSRELRTGDKVHKGDVLAVVWSVDVGGKKSDLVDALVQLRLDEQRLKDRIELWKNGNLPEDTLNQTRRDVISDRNAVDRAERTLRTWNVPEREIEVVRQEAEQAALRQGKRDKEKERLWARSELLAPRDGTLVERNIGVGEYVADNTINLFTIADVDPMLVIANPPEDYLPTLLALKPQEQKWTLSTVGSSDVESRIDEIGYILDANQHTAVVKGRIDNPKGLLRAGQFVSATINLPPPTDVVEVPLTALAEDGKQSYLFVQPDPDQPRFTMRRVLVTHRFDKTAFVKSQLSKAEAEPTADDRGKGLQPIEPLKVGEWYLPSGVLELRAALEDKESDARKEH